MTAAGFRGQGDDAHTPGRVAHQLQCPDETGLPFNLGLNSSANTNSAGGSRPDRIGSGVLPSDERSLLRWFDAGAFTQPPNGRFGNAARNALYGPGRVNF